MYPRVHHSCSQTSQLFGIWINDTSLTFEHLSCRVYLIIYTHINISVSHISISHIYIIYKYIYRCGPCHLSHNFCSFWLDSPNLSIMISNVAAITKPNRQMLSWCSLAQLHWLQRPQNFQVLAHQACRQGVYYHVLSCGAFVHASQTLLLTHWKLMSNLQTALKLRSFS